jgi:hypothetical protein
VEIKNETDNKTITATTDEQGLYVVQLLPGKVYSITTGSEECYNPIDPKRVDVGRPLAFDTTFVRDFEISRIIFPKYQLERYNIPFFVTGYWYPNTNANLDHLNRRVANGELGLFEGGNTPYIDREDEDYRSYANQIEAIFDTIYTSITQRYLSMFNKCALGTEKLKIEVRGFVDPRGLTPGYYPDKTIRTESMTIRKGEEMSGQSGNKKLANLRAYYTLEMIDLELATRSPLYRQLKDQNRVILTAYGVGIDVETGGSRLQDPAKRRIDIELSIIPGS